MRREGTEMTVEELRDRLEELVEAGHGEHEVMIVTQPNWPLRFTLAGVASTTEHDAQEDDASDEQAVVYLVEGGHPNGNPYGPRWAFDEAS